MCATRTLKHWVMAECSFVYEIKTEDFHEDIEGMKEHYDMSEYSKESGLYDGENKIVIGKFEDESPDEVIESFVGINSKIECVLYR